MVKETEKFDRERRVRSTRFAHFWSVPKGVTGCLLALAGWYKPHHRGTAEQGSSTCFLQGISFIHTSTP